ncbi:hypothetical protein PAMP_013605 [Pampus punctatissimus]
MTLILYVNEVRYDTRATHRPSFFVRMRFGEEGDASCASCGPTEQTSHVEARAAGEEAEKGPERGREEWMERRRRRRRRRPRPWHNRSL